MTSEADLSRAIQLALSSGRTRLFRRQIGTFWAGKVIKRTPTQVTLAFAYPIHCGEEYQADLYGMHEGRHVEIEVKRPNHNTARDRLEGQANYLRLTAELGGLAGFATSIEEARAILAGE